MAFVRYLGVTLLLLVTLQAVLTRESNEAEVAGEENADMFKEPHLPIPVDFNEVAEPTDVEESIDADFNEQAENLPELFVEPPPPEKEPVVVQWKHPMILRKEQRRKEEGKDRKKKGSRLVKSYKVNGDAVEFSSGSEDDHKRVKRSHLGDGVPDQFEFTMEALDPFTEDPAAFRIGSLISYRCSIHASHIETDVSIEIFSELIGGPLFIISNVRFGNIGSNFDNSFTALDKEVKYRSTYKDGRYDYARIDLGPVFNDASDTGTASASQIEVLFEAQPLLHPDLADDGLYRVSAGAVFSSSFITVAQDDLVYDATTTDTGVESYNAFELSGPGALNIKTTGVWTVTAAIHDLQLNLSIDVLTPLYLPHKMRIDSISIASVGENFRSAINDDIFNLTRSQQENFGDFVRVELGSIINTGYLNQDYEVSRNTITFEIAITMLDHEVNETHSYPIDVVLWTRDREANTVKIIWSGRHQVVAENNELDLQLNSAPEFSVTSSADVVTVGGMFGILINMTLPADSISDYTVEVGVPVFPTNVSVVDLGRMRISSIGFNIPHLHSQTQQISSRYVAENRTEFKAMHLGLISNTGQRNGANDNTVQVELAAWLLDEASNRYEDGEEVPISVGVRYSSGEYYWVGQTHIRLSNSPIIYSGNQVPQFVQRDVMGYEANIYLETAAIIDLDIVVPPGVHYQSMTIEFDSTNGTDSLMTAVKIIDSRIIHVGKSVIFGVNDTIYSGIVNETEANKEAVYNHVTWTLDHLTNVRDRSSPRYEFEESTIRMRLFVIAREVATESLHNLDLQWILTTVNVADSYIYTGMAGLNYSSADVNFYADSDWEPTIDMHLAEGHETNEVGYGTLLRYNVAVHIPYRTSASLRVRAEAGTSVPIQVCRIEEFGRGSAIVDYMPPSSSGLQHIYYSDPKKLIKMYTNMPALTSYGYGEYTNESYDAYINYTVSVMITEDATLSQSYVFNTYVGLGHLTTRQFDLAIIPTDAMPTMGQPVPIFNLTHQLGTNAINLGGSEVMYLDMFIPPGTSYKYNVTFSAPWNDTYTGEYEVLDAFIVSAGADLACFNPWMTVITHNDNEANFAINYVPNLAEPSGGFIASDRNKIRLALYVGLLTNTTLSVGDSLPVFVSVNMNNGADLWLGYQDLEILPPEDDRNAVPPHNFTLEVTGQSDKIFSIGEQQSYSAEIKFPHGSAASEFQIVIASPMVDGEALITIDQPKVISAGYDMLEARRYQEYIRNESEYRQNHTQTIDFGFIRNLDISGLSDFINRTGTEDVLAFEYTIRLMDHVSLIHNYQFDYNISIQFGNDTIIPATGDIMITVYAPDSDAAILDWEAYFTETPVDSEYDSVISFGLDLGVNHNTKRFPDSLSVFYRVPFFSTLVPNSLNFSGIESEFNASTTVDQHGLQFQWRRLRFDNDAHLNFSIIVDPDQYLEFGMLNRYVSIPIDIQYFEEVKSNPGTFEELYTSVTVLEFELNIPECMDPLGMADGWILDCQISASTDNGINTAQDARLNGTSGWATLERGPPFYQHEYIQVDMGDEVRITGVTIQPFNDNAVSRITSFKVQYSREGIHWEYIMESGNEKVFTVSWSAPITVHSTSLVEFGSLFLISRFIRILPYSNAESSYIHKLRFELNGCPWPYKSDIPAYECAAPADPVKAYEERQMMAINETVYVCMINKPNTLPFCSGSNDFGVSWFAIDDNVMNILGYEETGEAVYALARNRNVTLRSTDKGHTWAMVEEGDFAAMSSLPTYTTAHFLPFPLQGETTADLFAAYGFTDNDAMSWSVSNQAIHAYATNADGVAAKSASEDKVARWGTTEWNGP